jgi:tRNA1Val (adenine37-N6)-methyltransferase
MSVFRFRRFSVSNDLSSMKVNTDGVLLGAAATIDSADKSILDAGTGTGTIALMLAQRYCDWPSDQSGVAFCEERSITGIDIDRPASEEAEANFSASPWPGILTAANVALNDFCPLGQIDLIVSNPPFFEGSLEAPDPRRRAARHTGGQRMSYRDLLQFASRQLSASGRLSLILPAAEECGLLRYGRMCSLFPFRMMHIRTTPEKPFSRIIVEFSRVWRQSPCIEEELVIQDNREYTTEYKTLTGAFYL